MSLLKEYKELEQLRQEEAVKASKHYKGVDLPGSRTTNNSDKQAKQRIEEMRKLRELSS